MLLAALMGPTGAGKTALAVDWAERLGAEIINVDSRQIYRGMAIGTGAPTPEEQRRVLHHFVGHRDPNTAVSAKSFRDEAMALLREHPEKRFIAVGGTGLYFQEWLMIRPGNEAEDEAALTPALREKADGLLREQGPEAIFADLADRFPEAMAGIHPHDHYRLRKRLETYVIRGALTPPTAPQWRPEFSSLPLFHLHGPRPELHARIETRVRRMLEDGWAEEAQALLRAGVDSRAPGFTALGYGSVLDAVEGRVEWAVAERSIVARTREYAKKQITFFRHQFPTALPVAFKAFQQTLAETGGDPAALREILAEKAVDAPEGPGAA